MSEDYVWQITTPMHSEAGLRFTWVDDYRLRVRQMGTEVVIEGNAAGLESLARHLLTLAQPSAPSGSHLHLEDSTGLEPGSLALVIDREDDTDVYA